MLMQADILIPLVLVLEIYLAGMILNNVSTYFCAEMSGMKNFFYMEKTRAPNLVLRNTL